MKKFFIIIFSILFWATISSAAITPLSAYNGSLKNNPQNASGDVKVISYDDFAQLLAKVTKATEQDIKGKTMSVVPSLYEQQLERENNKSIFEKIYDKAIKKIDNSNINNRTDIVTEISMPTQSVAMQQQQWQTPGLPTIKVAMPPNNVITPVLAVEHVPYYMTELEVLNNGMVKITETIMVVADGNKLKKGLTKILPLRIHNGNGKKQHIDYTIIEVLQNDVPIDYHMTKTGDNILLVPDNDKPLAPGVYTYRFEILADNLLIDKNNAYMLYWNAGGNGWNLVVDRLGVLLTLPQSGGLLEHNVLFGNEDNLHAGAVVANPSGPTGMFYNARKPLFIGEGMYILAVINKDVMLPQSIWQKFMHKFYDYGDIMLAILGCLFITLSLTLSWRYIIAHKKLQKLVLVKTAPVLRYLYKAKFDIVSACGFLLDIYRKNLIDIQKSEETILLIKRTDNFGNLAKYERAAIKKLFPGHETIFNVTKNNRLTFSRFMKALRNGFNNQMSKFKLKLIIGYALICLVMLLLTAAFISYFKINSGLTLTISGSVLTICWLLLLLWNVSLPGWLKAIWRFIIIDTCIVGTILMSTVISPIAAIILMLSEIVIMVSMYFYGQRRGLMSYYIEDITNYRNNILNNTDSITLGKNFLNYQAAIWALELDNEIKPLKDKEYYKIPVMHDIVKVIKE